MEESYGCGFVPVCLQQGIQDCSGSSWAQTLLREGCARASVEEWAQRVSKLEKNYEDLSNPYTGLVERLNELGGNVNQLI